ncbi:RNA polymerase sigma factor [Amycolatopsis japonica]
MDAAPQPTEEPAPERAHDLIELPGEVLAQVEAELSVHGGRSFRDSAAQRAAEIRMLDILKAEEFTGPRFDRLFGKLAHQLVGYAHPIMKHWIGTGHIFTECLKFRRPIIDQARAAAAEWSGEQQQAFAVDAMIGTDAVLGGVGFFLDYGLKKGNWDPRKGASAATYFVGACTCCFAQFCNKWWKDKVVTEAMLSSPSDLDDEPDPLVRIADPAYNPEQLAVLRDTAARALAKVGDPKIQEVLLRRSYTGESQAEAAAAVDLTAKAAERRLHTHRRNLRANGDDRRWL